VLPYSGWLALGGPGGAADVLRFCADAAVVLTGVCPVLWLGEMMVHWQDTKREPRDDGPNRE
jgi:hypothetical protein